MRRSGCRFCRDRAAALKGQSQCRSTRAPKARKCDGATGSLAIVAFITTPRYRRGIGRRSISGGGGRRIRALPHPRWLDSTGCRCRRPPNARHPSDFPEHDIMLSCPACWTGCTILNGPGLAGSHAFIVARFSPSVGAEACQISHVELPGRSGAAEAVSELIANRTRGQRPSV